MSWCFPQENPHFTTELGQMAIHRKPWGERKLPFPRYGDPVHSATPRRCTPATSLQVLHQDPLRVAVGGGSHCEPSSLRASFLCSMATSIRFLQVTIYRASILICLRKAYTELRLCLTFGEHLFMPHVSLHFPVTFHPAKGLGCVWCFLGFAAYCLF